MGTDPAVPGRTSTTSWFSLHYTMASQANKIHVLLRICGEYLTLGQFPDE